MRPMTWNFLSWEARAGFEDGVGLRAGRGVLREGGGVCWRRWHVVCERGGTVFEG